MMQLSIAELRDMLDGRPKWPGAAKKHGDTGLNDAVAHGTIKWTPDGYVITDKGRGLVASHRQEKRYD